MRIKKGFELSVVCDENVVMATGIENIDFNIIISLNESAAYLWHKAEGKDFDAVQLAQWLTEEYEVSHEKALADAENIVSEWKSCGIIE